MCSQASVCSNVCSQILLDHDAEVNAASDFGETPLFRAVIYGRLITAQASSNVLLRFSASALHRYSSSTERMSARPATMGTLLCFGQQLMGTLSWSRLVTHSLRYLIGSNCRLSDPPRARREGQHGRRRWTDRVAYCSRNRRRRSGRGRLSIDFVASLAENVRLSSSKRQRLISQTSTDGRHFISLSVSVTTTTK